MTNVLTSLLDLIARWFGDEDLQEEYSLREYLESKDYDDLDASELYAALGLYFDTLPVSVQRQQGDFSREYNTGARVNVQQHVDPPPPPKHDDDWESVNQYVNYLTTNYTYVQDDDTIVDNSVNTQIQADGDVRFDQDIDNNPTVVSGDENLVVGGKSDIDDSQLIQGGVKGSQIAGDDIEDSLNVGGDIDDSLIANRSDVDRAVVGHDNKAVMGDDNATAFGKGDVSQAKFGDVTVDDGSALAVGGDAYGYNDESREYKDSFNEDNDDVTIKDSFNEDNDDVTVKDSFQDNDDVTVKNSFNPDNRTDNSTDITDNRTDNSHDIDVI